jgi:hypothetical protein
MVVVWAVWTAAMLAVEKVEPMVERMVASTGRRMAGAKVGTKVADSAVDWAETRAAQRGDAKVEHLAELWVDVKAGTMAAELVPR